MLGNGREGGPGNYEREGVGHKTISPLNRNVHYENFSTFALKKNLII